MSEDMDFTVSREAVLDARLFDLAPKFNDVGEPLAYEVSDIPENTYPKHVIPLFQADCAAVRASRRLEGGRTVAAIVIVRPPLSREPDDVLIELARESLSHKMAEFAGGE